MTPASLLLADNTMQSIFWMVGIALLVLSGAAGVALFLRAIGVSDADSKGEDARRGTLWGLFLVGLIAGLILVGIASAT